MARKSIASLKREYSYFFLNGYLHKLVDVYRKDDIAKCYNYDTKEYATYNWSEIQKNARKAFSMGQVCKLLRINKTTVWKYEKLGLIKNIRRSWPVGTNPDLSIGGPALARRFSSEDILNLYDALVDVNNGRAHKTFPERFEVEAAMENKRILYYRDEFGNFKPLWRNNE